jgi:hypothetical protein
VSRHPVPVEPVSTLTIPKELWYPTQVHNVLPPPKPHLPMLVGLLPAVALVSGYLSALTSTAHVATAAAVLLLVALAALVGLGCGLNHHALASLRHYRSESGK